MTRFCRGSKEPGRSVLASAAAQTDSSVQCRQFYVLQRALLGAFCFFPFVVCAVILVFALHLSGSPGSSVPSWGHCTRPQPALPLTAIARAFSPVFGGSKSGEILPGAEHWSSPAAVPRVPGNLLGSRTSFPSPPLV